MHLKKTHFNRRDAKSAEISALLVFSALRLWLREIGCVRIGALKLAGGHLHHPIQHTRWGGKTSPAAM
jgi:hypothetical protein